MSAILGNRIPGRPALALLLAAATVFGTSSCGPTSEKFTSGEADRALAALDSVEVNVDEGRCEAARKNINRLAVQATHVNDDRPELGDAYASSVARLQALVARECVEISSPGPTAPVTSPTGPEGGTESPKPTDETGGGQGGDKPSDNTGGDNGGAGGGGQGGGENPGDNDGNQPPADSGGAGPGT